MKRYNYVEYDNNSLQMGDSSSKQQPRQSQQHKQLQPAPVQQSPRTQNLKTKRSKSKKRKDTSQSPSNKSERFPREGIEQPLQRRDVAMQKVLTNMTPNLQNKPGQLDYVKPLSNDDWQMNASDSVASRIVPIDGLQEGMMDGVKSEQNIDELAELLKINRSQKAILQMAYPTYSKISNTKDNVRHDDIHDNNRIKTKSTIKQQIIIDQRTSNLVGQQLKKRVSKYLPAANDSKLSSNKLSYNQLQSQKYMLQPQADPNFVPSIISKLFLKITMIIIKPSQNFNIERLIKSYSRHNAVLTATSSKHIMANGSVNTISYKLEQQGGYYKQFVLTDDGALIVGDNTIWQILDVTIRGDKMTKVGMYNCLTKYHNYKDDGLLRQRINGSTYTKWEEIEPELSKNVENQYVNKYLLQNPNISFQMIEYRQINKYYSQKDNQWRYTMYVKQKFYNFQGWIIEGKITDLNEQIITDGMIKTIKNDLLNREKLYIKQMKAKSTYKK